MPRRKPERQSAITCLKLTPQDLEDISEEDEPQTPAISGDEIFRDNRRTTSCRRCDRLKQVVSDLESQVAQYQTRERASGAGLHRSRLQLLCDTTGNRIKMRKTDIHCWWDRHPFSGYPCMLPQSHIGGVYRVTGCFCSFNCMLAYNLYTLRDDQVSARRSLALRMFREMQDIPGDQPVEISEAPPWELLRVYGGTMEIEDYRRTFSGARKYWKIEAPIQVLDLAVIEGEDANPVQKRGYALSRTAPSGGRSLRQFTTTRD